MKALVVLGSPRKKGNSQTLVEAVASGITKNDDYDVEYIRLQGRQHAPCRGCGGCEKTGNCVIKDELTELFDKVDEAEIVLLVTPVYFYGPSAQLKTFIDRFQSRWSRKYLLKQPFRPGENRKGCLVATAATKGPKVFESCVLIAKSFFDTVDIPYGGDVVVRSVDEKGAINENKEELDKAREFGRALTR